MVMVVTVPESSDKPHTDKDGIVWIKNGSEKMKVAGKDQLSRLVNGGNRYDEERLLQHSSLDDLDWYKFQSFYEENIKRFAKKKNYRNI